MVSLDVSMFRRGKKQSKAFSVHLFRQVENNRLSAKQSVKGLSLDCCVQPAISSV